MHSAHEQGAKRGGEAGVRTACGIQLSKWILTAVTNTSLLIIIIFLFFSQILNIYIEVFKWVYFPAFLGYIFRSGAFELYDHFVFKYFGICQKF